MDPPAEFSPLSSGQLFPEVPGSPPAGLVSAEASVSDLDALRLSNLSEDSLRYPLSENCDIINPPLSASILATPAEGDADSPSDPSSVLLADDEGVSGTDSSPQHLLLPVDPAVDALSDSVAPVSSGSVLRLPPAGAPSSNVAQAPGPVMAAAAAASTVATPPGASSPGPDPLQQGATGVRWPAATATAAPAAPTPAPTPATMSKSTAASPQTIRVDTSPGVGGVSLDGGSQSGPTGILRTAGAGVPLHGFSESLLESLRSTMHVFAELGHGGSPLELAAERLLISSRLMARPDTAVEAGPVAVPASGPGTCRPRR
ncbi:hypothetical protein H696_00683 [Fonticula alba]|uniref:Uncharacterized protein n=1 Tax=Fonticula alba TaxID=691883 RepID=A0A058ZFH0_FONAL|nr:hypothetical protein H696_00683 [Fonticula alba]KCV73135.1 hypothetical protein H696_00683 [Fonticula alba]|eukprot:XP_009492836.1 hypothetical protein H696_00683 [Fonticula alba]